MDQLSVDFRFDLVAILDRDDDGASPRSNAAACDNRDLPLVGSHHTATRISRSSPTTAATGRPNAADSKVRSIAGIQP
jgi:pullulanase/glycogen debranching enzyme